MFGEVISEKHVFIYLEISQIFCTLLVELFKTHTKSKLYVLDANTMVTIQKNTKIKIDFTLLISICHVGTISPICEFLCTNMKHLLKIAL